MTCSQCTTRILRSLAADLSVPATATSRRSIARPPPSRAAIRHASSSAPRSQSAETSNPPASSTPDFLGLFNAAQTTEKKQALSAWGSAWKPETDLSSIRGGAVRLPDPTLVHTRKEASEEYVDDFAPQPIKTEDSATASPSVEEQASTTAPSHKDQLDAMPAALKRKFPTRASPAEEIPWENPTLIAKKISTPHTPDSNAWKDWSTPALWSHKKVRELYKPKELSNGARMTKYAALTVPLGEMKWEPSITATFGNDSFRAGMNSSSSSSSSSSSRDGRNQTDVQPRTYDEDTPSWLIHKDAVKTKLKGKTWKPFSRLSPAAVATLKQLKAENPGMTVEEYAPIFKISPDALRRILRSKWQPTAAEEEDRAERWKRRGDSVWKEWAEKGLVETKESRKEKKERKERIEQEKVARKGFVMRRGLNLKNRIL
ncbi:hypothetical protein H072_980 [Dactylellina haptotyla CBS 200.50]|uniref:Required for respiratory growth protein 9, mitochondrial n=1 Tax=Dactylellina haptotyla (strain CBS 200.50) TaxID=1284197 RepID=S8AQ31_DACHA|nr:hypothetical protein H072_980 [Dactylellina haptotyla CBS 200.50]